MFLSILFWTATGIIIYTYLGYPALVCLLARFFPQPIHKDRIYPSITLVIAAYNEELVIGEKLENSLNLNYPPELLDIVVAADGSSDDTVEIARSFPGKRIKVFHKPERRGKAAAINRIMPNISSEIVVLTDANAMLEPESLSAIAGSFNDPAVGGVAGEKRVIGGGEGLYWRYESKLKQCDSAISSVMGAAGEILAIRRDLYQPPAADDIIEDFMISMKLVGARWRIVYEPKAVAAETASPTLKGDWQRRVRNAAGGFRSLRRLSVLLHPRMGRIAWQFFSHRVLRWAVAPFLLPLVFFINWSLIERPFYGVVFVGQLIFYATAVLGYLRGLRGVRSGIAHTIFYFCFTNLAAIAGFGRFLTKQQPVTWKKAR